MNLQTTLNILRAAQPCSEGWAKLMRSLPARLSHDTPISFEHILNINGLDDALWALRCVLPEQEKQRDCEARLFACDCAESVLHIFEAKYPDDKWPRKCVEVARRFAHGEATKEELSAAGAAAGAGAMAAARDAAYDAATGAAYDAAYAAAGGSEEARQEAQFRARFCTQEASK